MEIKQYEAMLGDAESRLKRLRAMYDQWFAGVERIEPQQQRRDFDNLLNTLRRDQPRNTALRFRFNQVVQRYTTYTTYWRRIARQIEEGTYKRDVIRARRLTEVTSEPPPPRQDSYEIDVDVDVERAVDSALDAAIAAGASSRPPRQTPHPMPPISPFAMPDEPKNGAPLTAEGEPARSFPVPGAPPPPLAAGTRPRPPAPPIPGAAMKRPPPPPAVPGAARPAAPAASAGAPASGISEDHMQRIYEKYVDARRKNQERTDVKLESVARSVRDMMPKLLQKHAGKSIDFEVVVRDGKVALKPVAK